MNEHPTESSQRLKTKTNPEYEEQRPRQDPFKYSVHSISGNTCVQEGFSSSSMNTGHACIPRTISSHSDVMHHDKV